MDLCASGYWKVCYRDDLLIMSDVWQPVLAALFCPRSDPTCNHPGSQVATLAYQSRPKIPGFEDLIEKSILQDSLIFIKSFETQLLTLIEPLHTMVALGINLPLS